LARPFDIALHSALAQHGVGYLQKACDVGIFPLCAAPASCMISHPASGRAMLALWVPNPRFF